MQDESGQDSSLTVLPEILAVIEGTLIVDTDDDQVGRTILAGFHYYLALEFARQQPVLSLLYSLDIQILEVSRGSRHYRFKALVRLKKRVGAFVKKIGGVAGIAALLALPPAIESSLHLYRDVVSHTEQKLNSDMPITHPKIEIHEIRPPDSREHFEPKGGGSFDLDSDQDDK